MPDLHIVCLRPSGMNRGGVRHEGHKVHKLDAFTPAQLREIRGDPNFAVILGGETLTEELIAEMELPAKPSAKK